MIYFYTFMSTVNTISVRGNKVLVTLYAIYIGANSMEIGFLIGISAFFPIFLAVFAGKLSDQFGNKYPVIISSLGLSMALLLPFMFPGMMIVLYFSQSLLGIAEVFFHISILNFVGALAEGNERIQNISTFSLGGPLGGLIGPVSVGLFIDNFGYLITFLYLAVIAIIPACTLFSTLRLKENIKSKSFPKAIKETKEKLGNKNLLDLIKIPELRKVFIIGGILVSGVGLYTFYFPIFGESIGLSATVIGLIISIHSLAFVVVRLIMPVLIKIFQENNLFTIVLILSGLTYVLLPFFENAYVLAVLSFILGMVLGCGQPLTTLITYNLAPQNRTGEALGMRMTVHKITNFAFPIIAGAMGVHFGLSPIFWLTSFFLVIGGCFNGKHNQKKERGESQAINKYNRGGSKIM